MMLLIDLHFYLHQLSFCPDAESNVSSDSGSHSGLNPQFFFSSSTRDTVVPLSKPITGVDGSKISELAVPKDTLVFVSSINSNRNPELWPDALEWKPERWLSPPSEALTNAHIPGVYSNLYVLPSQGASVQDTEASVI